MKKSEILNHVTKKECVEVIKELFNVFDMQEIDMQEIYEKNYDTSMLDINDKYYEYNYNEVISYKDDDELIETFAEELELEDLID